MSEDPFTRDAGSSRTDEMEKGREGEASADSEGWSTDDDEPEPGASGDEMSEDNDGGPPARQRPGGPY